MGLTVVSMMLANIWTDNTWIRRGVFILQVLLLLRLLNPLLEGIAIKGRQKRIAGGEEEKEISFVRKILFGKSGKLRFPRLIH